jgi:protocatechuate 3,4-dioxygenase beta subunit
VVALSWVVLPVAALFSILASGAIGALTPLGALTPEASAQAQTPPPACTPNSRPTPSQTEGPFYKPNSPQRTSLVEPGMAGTKITVTGFLFSTDCRPVARARLDFWQADDRGAYDNTGYRLRGHTFADDAGRYSMETILPGSYTGRTRHIHVKVQAPNRPALTTQLYFPDEARNQNDGIFNQNLIVTMRDTPAGKVATFNFILDLR